MTVGERMKKRRIELGIRAEDIATAAGISRSTLFRYERGGSEKLPIQSLVPIASALRTTVGYLMGWESETALSAKGESGKEAAVIFESLPDSKKEEALRYLRYLSKTE